MIADIPVLECISLDLRKYAIARGRSSRSSVTKGIRRYSKQSDLAFRHLGAPHAVAGRFGADQHVQIVVLVFQKGKLVDRTARNANCARVRTVKRHPKEH